MPGGDLLNLLPPMSTWAQFSIIIVVNVGRRVVHHPSRKFMTGLSQATIRTKMNAMVSTITQALLPSFVAIYDRGIGDREVEAPAETTLQMVDWPR